MSRLPAATWSRSYCRHPRGPRRARNAKLQLLLVVWLVAAVAVAFPRCAARLDCRISALRSWPDGPGGVPVLA